MKRVAPVLSSTDIDTILAALRSFQLDVEVLGKFDNLDPQIQDLATNGGEHAPMNKDEIDDLCNRLNCAVYE